MFGLFSVACFIWWTIHGEPYVLIASGLFATADAIASIARRLIVKDDN